MARPKTSQQGRMQSGEQLRVLADVATPFFAAELLMNLALTVPHAILTPLLLDKGLSLSQILLVQAGFSVAVLLFEFPSGSIADMISRRTLYFISRLVFCIFFLVVIFGHGFPLMLLAWIVYGLATALESGTLDAALINNAKNRQGPAGTVGGLEGAVGAPDHVESRISWLVRKEGQSAYLGMMIGSTIGALLYLSVGANIYFISVGATVISVVTIALFFRIPEQHKVASVGENEAGASVDKHDAARIGGALRLWQELRSHARATVEEMRNSAALRQFLLLAVVAQAFLQLHFQLWQAVGLEKGFGESHLLFLYLLFIGMAFGASFIRPEVLFRRRGLVVAAVVAFPGLAWLSYLADGWAYLVFYGALAFLLIVFANYSAFGVRRASSVERIGAVTSLVGVVGRIGAIGVLAVASVFVNFYSAAAVASGGFVVLVVLGLGWVGLRRWQVGQK
ncbi:MFS transporter [Corynebacterium pseudodiphtheriticum]|uniref:MFS transporter n=1 Tax=Corynebacterium pseudodiphtheriticum TaxID=37637 RepID=UPI000F884997|nr:MFS transporter [Corynebacterium pseudodiphtheriticum]MDC7068870.1 MFS transporter [Corynebacterium pseudodiphtheriticum]MDC7084914.1 MFS transporter [Corynebacterium pseudodiphtheriticum]MDC7086964.1 MFS transporter [Corynebacterium pseudodiphtheriticum]MDK4207023.1 MFS transporter [Corynebacterium pseudodiphtheriticum]MDK4243871.1 MFS transporter [Corynebacterium pseudodiphtheriticum]